VTLFRPKAAVQNNPSMEMTIVRQMNAECHLPASRPNGDDAVVLADSDRLDSIAAVANVPKQFIEP